MTCRVIIQSRLLNWWNSSESTKKIFVTKLAFNKKFWDISSLEIFAKRFKKYKIYSLNSF
jgi:hypothetical protein